MNNKYSEHTLIRYKQVVRLLPQLYENKFNKTFNFPESLEDFDNIVQMLSEKYKPSTLPNCISGIIWHIDTMDNISVSLQSVRDKYKMLSTKLIADSFKESFSNNKTLSEREQKTFQSWDNIIKMYNTMHSNLNKNNYNSFLEFVIISLYILHPPVRSDYANMKIFIDDSFIPPNYQENYCVLQTNPRLVFNKYKTSKKYGQNIVYINDDLHNILLDWMEINKSEYLLTSYIQYKKEFKPFTEETLSHRIPLIFKKYTNIPSNINTLRHAYVTYANKSDISIDNLISNKENSNKMMHSINMAEGYKRIIQQI